MKTGTRILFVFFAIACFLVGYIFASVAANDYIFQQCRHFDYNQHWRWTWKWWEGQCSQVL